MEELRRRESHAGLLASECEWARPHCCSYIGNISSSVSIVKGAAARGRGGGGGGKIRSRHLLLLVAAAARALRLDAIAVPR